MSNKEEVNSDGEGDVQHIDEVIWRECVKFECKCI